MKKLFTFLFIFFTIGLLAKEAPNTFQQGNKAFQEKSYSEAIDLYESVLAKGEHSAALYFNLGNAYFKNNELGKAILNYERAKRLRPHFKDLDHNLAIAENYKKDNITPVRPFFLISLWKNTYQLTSPVVWAFFGILMLLISIAGIAFWLLSSIREHKQRGFYGGLIGLSLGVVFLLLGYGRHLSIHSHQDAVIVTEKVGFKDGADEDSNTTQSLHEGTKIRLIEAIGDWHKVRLGNGEEGWLNESDFEAI